MPGEARLEQAEVGLTPATPGWYVVNVRDAVWLVSDAFGATAELEGTPWRFEDTEFPELGIRIVCLEPGRANGLYHRENAQEAYLVLSGECLLLVEGEERRLGAWDFAHFPPNTEHIVVGAGDGPSVVLMVGKRPCEPITYSVSDVALRHGAGVEVEAPSPREAYEGYPEERFERPPYWDSLPWARAEPA